MKANHILLYPMSMVTRVVMVMGVLAVRADVGAPLRRGYRTAKKMGMREHIHPLLEKVRREGICSCREQERAYYPIT